MDGWMDGSYIQWNIVVTRDGGMKGDERLPFLPNKKRKEKRIRTYVLVEEALVVRIAQQLVRFPFVVVVYVAPRPSI